MLRHLNVAAARRHDRRRGGHLQHEAQAEVVADHVADLNAEIGERAGSDRAPEGRVEPAHPARPAAGAGRQATRTTSSCSRSRPTGRDARRDSDAAGRRRPTPADARPHRRERGGDARSDDAMTEIDLGSMPSDVAAGASADVASRGRAAAGARATRWARRIRARHRRLRDRLSGDRRPAGRCSASSSPATPPPASIPTRRSPPAGPTSSTATARCSPTDIKTASLYAEPRNIIDPDEATEAARPASCPISTPRRCASS